MLPCPRWRRYEPANLTPAEVVGEEEEATVTLPIDFDFASYVGGFVDFPPRSPHAMILCRVRRYLATLLGHIVARVVHIDKTAWIVMHGAGVIQRPCRVVLCV